MNEYGLTAKLFDHEHDARFEGYEYKIEKNSQGIYKVRIRATESHKWHYVSNNDLAIAIVGRGDPGPKLFFNRGEVQNFIDQHIKGLYKKTKPELTIDDLLAHDFEEVE